MPSSLANTARLHRYLGTVLVLVAAASLVVTYLGMAPILRGSAIPPVIAYVPPAIAMALVGVALVGLKPRVPGRRMEQSVEEFWSAPETGGKVLLIWFLLEGAGTIAAVGYFLTGAPASAIVMGLATAACWLCGPSQFARG